MIRAGLIGSLCVAALFLRGQPTNISQISYTLDDTVQGAYKPRAKQQHLFIASRFGSPDVDPSRALDSVSGFLINDIVLVFSKYKQSDNFSQARLNAARWENLLKSYPQLFQSGTTKYGNICQAGIHNDSVARELTHGFYIYYENRSDPEERNKEIAEISKMLDRMGVDTSGAATPEPAVPASEVIPVKPGSSPPRFKKPMRAKDPKACRQAYYKNGLNDLNAFFRSHIELTNRQKRHPEKVTAEVQVRLSYNGRIRSAYVLSTDDEFIKQIREALADMSLWHPAVLNGITINTSVKFNLICTEHGKVKLKGGLIPVRSLLKCGTQPDEMLFDFTEPGKTEKLMPSDYEVSDRKLLRQVIDRNAQLDSILLVVDLTGSMGPYIAQVLELMTAMVEKNDKRILSIALFNDGDGRPDRSKKVGKTGGIIILQGDITLDVLGNAVIKCMKKGNGGDVMENNIEAVLQGLEVCKGCKRVMMVADNFATPRDRSLLGQVQRPMNWLLCGAYGGINTNYLDLVRENRGTLHTGTSDVKDLHLVKEGDVITIDGYGYQLKEGIFRMVSVR